MGSIMGSTFCRLKNGKERIEHTQSMQTEDDNLKGGYNRTSKLALRHPPRGLWGRRGCRGR